MYKYFGKEYFLLLLLLVLLLVLLVVVSVTIVFVATATTILLLLSLMLLLYCNCTVYTHHRANVFVLFFLFVSFSVCLLYNYCSYYYFYYWSYLYMWTHRHKYTRNRECWNCCVLLFFFLFLLFKYITQAVTSADISLVFTSIRPFRNHWSLVETEKQLEYIYISIYIDVYTVEHSYNWPLFFANPFQENSPFLSLSFFLLAKSILGFSLFILLQLAKVFSRLPFSSSLFLLTFTLIFF